MLCKKVLAAGEHLEQEDLLFAQKVQRIKQRILLALMILPPLLLAVAIGLGVYCQRLTQTAASLKAQLSQQALNLESSAARLIETQQQLANLQAQQEIREEQLSPEILAYQSAYPGLYVDAAPSVSPSDNTVYLTFDDGPSGNTSALLDVLDKYNVKATFFVVGAQIKGREDILKEVAARGHTIGMHSESHNYKQIYASVDAFLKDYDTLSQRIQDVTGQKPAIFRFPGGSVNGYNQGLYQELIAEMLRRGYTYYDWNVSAQDATTQSKTVTEIADAVSSGVPNHRYSIVLLHDSSLRETTVKAVNQLIPELLENGYHFESLDNAVSPIIFSYK